MIDTDKYEGHLIDKAVEDNSQVWVWKNWMLKNAETIEQHRATAALLNDAPLLLAEVKHLNRRLVEADSLIDTLQTIADNQAEEVKRLRSEIEHLNMMFCVGCGACGTETEYAECTCTEEMKEWLTQNYKTL
jgi:hypothetical protein